MWKIVKAHDQAVIRWVWEMFFEITHPVFLYRLKIQNHDTFHTDTPESDMTLLCGT